MESDALRSLVLHVHDDCTVIVAAWSPCGAFVATGSNDTTTRLWCASTGRVVHELCGHTGYVDCVVWSPCSKFMATGSNDETARVWFFDKANATCDLMYVLTTHTGSHTDEDMTAIAWSPCGAYITTASENSGVVRVWLASTGQQLCALRGHTSLVDQMVWSPCGAMLACGSEWSDRTVRVWRFEKSQTTGNPTCGLSLLSGHPGRITSLAWSPVTSPDLVNGACIATASTDSVVRVWRLVGTSGDGELVRMLNGHRSRVTSVAWSPCGAYIASGSNDWTTLVWRVSPGVLVYKLCEHSYNPWVAWSPCGTYISTHVCKNENYVSVWLACTGGKVRWLRGHTAELTSVVWSPVVLPAFANGARVVTTSYDGTARIWTVCKWTTHSHRCFTPAARLLVRRVMCARDRLASTANAYKISLPLEIWLLVFETMFEN